jgi:hypothetical protein
MQRGWNYKTLVAKYLTREARGIFDESSDFCPAGFTDYSFQAKKGSKLHSKYGSSFFWTIRRNNRTGECEFLEAGD